MTFAFNTIKPLLSSNFQVNLMKVEPVSHPTVIDYWATDFTGVL